MAINILHFETKAQLTVHYTISDSLGILVSTIETIELAAQIKVYHLKLRNDDDEREKLP